MYKHRASRPRAKRRNPLSGKLRAAVARGYKPRTLRDTQLRAAIEYYITNRNCAPVSKSSLLSTLNANLADWMDIPILSIDTTMLQERYRAVIERVKATR